MLMVFSVFCISKARLYPFLDLKRLLPRGPNASKAHMKFKAQ